jgi:predicted cupin superfamily sugar epimerase
VIPGDPSTFTANEVIEALGLRPLPEEGGWYRETFRSNRTVEGVPGHCAGTCIYYLLQSGEKSFWHQVGLDEIWLHHAGAPAVQILLFPDGRWEERILGTNIMAGEVPQSTIPAGVWQAAVPLFTKEKTWSLFGAVVVPGFEFSDYRHGDPEDLLRQWTDAAGRCRELGLGE